MVTIEVPVTHDVAQELRIAILEHEWAQLKAQLLQIEARQLLETAERTWHAVMQAFVASFPPHLPRPGGPFTLDLEALCVRYEAAMASMATIPCEDD